MTTMKKNPSSISANPSETLQPFQLFKKIEKNEVFQILKKCAPDPMIFIKYNREFKILLK
jgi:hypothetical protein